MRKKETARDVTYLLIRVAGFLYVAVFLAT